MPSNALSARRAPGRRPPICISKKKPIIVPPPPPPWSYASVFFYISVGCGYMNATETLVWTPGQQAYFFSKDYGTFWHHIWLHVDEATSTAKLRVHCGNSNPCEAYGEKHAISITWGATSYFTAPAPWNVQNPSGSYAGYGTLYI